MNPVMVFLDAIRDHLDLHELPPVGSIDVTKWSNPITVQLDVDGLADVARALLVWANTLDAVTAQIQRMRTVGSVHLSISGRTPCGAPVLVYGSVPFSEDVFPDLPAGAKQDMPVFVLRGWADAGEVAA
ncbi:hypothetical protein ACFWY9_37410 [Amycolatopsis sp. NPDC059027]|uniref:hypothetical protein n=1 Tax=Amycolatopsis sp. NPDC059027 TaxID=3346709 RepID=UPI00366A9676